MNTLYITGVSAESGIPTFRGEDGFWTIGSNHYTPHEMATRRMYQTIRWNFYHGITSDLQLTVTTALTLPMIGWQIRT